MHGGFSVESDAATYRNMDRNKKRSCRPAERKSVRLFPASLLSVGEADRMTGVPFQARNGRKSFSVVYAFSLGRVEAPCGMRMVFMSSEPPFKAAATFKASSSVLTALMRFWQNYQGSYLSQGSDYAFPPLRRTGSPHRAPMEKASRRARSRSAILEKA